MTSSNFVSYSHFSEYNSLFATIFILTAAIILWFYFHSNPFSFDVVFNLPESQVIILPGNPSRGGDYRVSKGDVVFAIYPDTTSFYKATVVQAPRKQGGANSGNQVVMVNFVDDSDEFGITHDKAVPFKHVMPPP
jgi:SGF29 tudor-like domain